MKDEKFRNLYAFKYVLEDGDYKYFDLVKAKEVSLDDAKTTLPSIDYFTSHHSEDSLREHLKLDNTGYFAIESPGNYGRKVNRPVIFNNKFFQNFSIDSLKKDEERVNEEQRRLQRWFDGFIFSGRFAEYYCDYMNKSPKIARARTNNKIAKLMDGIATADFNNRKSQYYKNDNLINYNSFKLSSEIISYLDYRDFYVVALEFYKLVKKQERQREKARLEKEKARIRKLPMEERQISFFDKDYRR